MESIEYVDPVNGCHGYLVYDARQCRLAAGGCRVQRGLTVTTLAELAARMTLKQRVLGLNVDGAKCGLDYDPQAADLPEVLTRFLAFLRDELTERFSMGCDMGTRFDELQRIARTVGIPSIKCAVQVAQELTSDDFRQRLRVLDGRVGRRTVSERRAGHALAHAALAAATRGGYRAPGLRVALQGFGNLGRSAAESLAESGAVLVGLADEFGCVTDPTGLDVSRLLDSTHTRPVPALVDGAVPRPSEALFDLDPDVLVLAGGEDAISPDRATAMSTPVVVVGANCGLSTGAEQVLIGRGTLVIPDFVGGAGGSASMEALFGPARPPEPADVLANLATLMTELVSDMLAGAHNRSVAPAQVARDIAAAALVPTTSRPYGGSPYAAHGPVPSGRRGRLAAATLPDPVQRPGPVQ